MFILFAGNVHEHICVSSFIGKTQSQSDHYQNLAQEITHTGYYHRYMRVTFIYFLQNANNSEQDSPRHAKIIFLSGNRDLDS